MPSYEEFSRCSNDGVILEEKEQLAVTFEKDISEVAEIQSQKHPFHLKSVNLTDNGSQREARIHDIEAEISHSRIHELTSMVNSVNEPGRSHNEHDSQMSSKLSNSQVLREYDGCSRSLKWNEERVRVLEMDLISKQESDNLRKISLKMLRMETKSQTNGVANSLPLNTGGGSQNPQDPASHSMQSQVRNPGQSQIPLANPSQARQQLLTQNIQNNITNSGIQGPAPLSSTLPSGADVLR